MFVHGTLQSYHLLLLKQVLHFRDEKYGRNEPTNRGKMFFFGVTFFFEEKILAYVTCSGEAVYRSITAFWNSSQLLMYMLYKNKEKPK